MFVEPESNIKPTSYESSEPDPITINLSSTTKSCVDIVVVLPNTFKLPVIVALPPTDKLVVTSKLFPIVTSSGKPNVSELLLSFSVTSISLLDPEICISVIVPNESVNLINDPEASLPPTDSDIRLCVAVKLYVVSVDENIVVLSNAVALPIHHYHQQ